MTVGVSVGILIGPRWQFCSLRYLYQNFLNRINFQELKNAPIRIAQNSGYCSVHMNI